MSIWMLFYLQFTNYAGIGLIETVAIFTIIVTEIPTGALADLVGKKYTIISALIFQFVGQLIMASTTSFITLPISVIIISIGASLYSGAFEALLYDSLKEKGKEKSFNKVFANTESFGLIATGIASIIGGITYANNNQLPFILTGICMLIGAFAAMFLKEPKVDTKKFSWKSYKTQTILGFKHLFDKSTVHITKSLLFITVLFTIMYNIGFDVFTFNLGFSEQQLGLFFAILYFSTALASQATPYLHKFIGIKKIIISFSFLYGIILIVASKFSHLSGGMLILTSAWIAKTISNTRSKILNDNTPSSLRATTLSTFNMLNTIPYVALAYLIGKSIDIVGPKQFIYYIGLLAIVASFAQMKILNKKHMLK